MTEKSIVELVAEVVRRTNSTQIDVPFGCKVEVAAENPKIKIEKEMPDGRSYTSDYYHDEIYEGPCVVIVMPKRRGFERKEREQSK